MTVTQVSQLVPTPGGIPVRSLKISSRQGRVFMGGRLRHTANNDAWYYCHNNHGLDGACPQDRNRLGYTYSYAVAQHDVFLYCNTEIETGMQLCPKEAL